MEEKKILKLDTEDCNKALGEYVKNIPDDDIIGKTAVLALQTPSEELVDVLEKTELWGDQTIDPEFQELASRIRLIRNELNIRD